MSSPKRKSARRHPTHRDFVGVEPERPRRYLRLYHARSGHRYLVQGIPDEIWRKAVDRADAEDVSIRQVILLALKRYGQLGFPSSAWGEGGKPPVRPPRFTPVQTTAVPGLRCAQCGHQWIARTAQPAKCPHCQSRRWDRR
jgi:hypothetical protein